MKLLENQKYLDDLKEYASFNLDWNLLKNKTILLSGATGLIGRYLVDLLMYKNIHDNLEVEIIAICRNKDKANNMFLEYLTNQYFKIIKADVTNEIKYDGKIDYIIHAASNTHPVQYATDPVGTIKTNVLGTYNLLNLGLEKKIKKFILTSSFEVYGKVDSNIKKIKESDIGNLDWTILRSSYPESKRLSESLLISYANQYNLDVNMVRLSRVFGPTMSLESELATAQFLKKGLKNEDIILKSDGEQLYSYNYVGDAVIAIILVILKGQSPEAYNVSNKNFDIKLKDFAKIVASYVNRKVVFELPNDIKLCGIPHNSIYVELLVMLNFIKRSL